MKHKEPQGPRERTGWSRRLRERLRLRREDLKLTQQDVADRIAADLGEEKRTGGSIGHYENFIRHPEIDVMAAWARVLGWRLVVDFDELGSGRIPVLIHPESAQIVRALDKARRDAPEKFETVQKLVDQLIGLDPEESE